METELDKEWREAQEALRELNAPSLSEEALICECYCVSVGDIREAFKDSRKVDVSLLTSRFGLGTGCGKCLRESENWIKLIFSESR